MIMFCVCSIFRYFVSCSSSFVSSRLINSAVVYVELFWDAETEAGVDYFLSLETKLGCSIRLLRNNIS